MDTRLPNDRLAAVLRETGLSRKAFARAVSDVAAEHGRDIGCDHTRVSNWLSGVQPRSVTASFIAEALARRLGRPLTMTDLGFGSAGPVDGSLGLLFPAGSGDARDVVVRLVEADLAESEVIVSGNVSASAWNDAALGWLLTSCGAQQMSSVTGGRRVGASDVRRVQGTTAAFARLDDQFGGNHARRAFLQYVMGEVFPLLREQYGDAVGRQLHAAAAHAAMLAAWMSYDSGRHRVAQRYFVQAAGLAAASGDQRLAGSVFDAMSHQATFVGRLSEAANLAGAARAGNRGDRSSLMAHFHTMEARALARLGDARGCERALSDAVRAYERRRPGDDPEWFTYFDDAELSAELGHCFRDLGRPEQASAYAAKAHVPTTSPRSGFFAGMVHATARLDAGDLAEACSLALNALTIGRDVESARCVAYVSDFRVKLEAHSGHRAVLDFAAEAERFPMWLSSG